MASFVAGSETMGLTDTITKADTSYNPPSTLASPNGGGQGQYWALMATWGQFRVTFSFNCGLVTGFEDNYLCRVPSMGQFGIT